MTQDEMLAALHEAFQAPQGTDALTGPELARLMGCHENGARRALRVLIADGGWEVVTVRRTALDGRVMTLKGYRPKAA